MSILKHELKWYIHLEISDWIEIFESSQFKLCQCD